ncbi:MAG: Glu/Leu/Phe/Val dehydrogenase [Chloroflexi bacterium]|nr:Glu/Leu/Phe/Val dehydrogenase [Chloroflexota bacterium]
MKIIEYMQKHDYEELVICIDRNVGLRAIIVIHDTTLGPALGGTRMWSYPSEEEAMQDALRLAKGMTYRAAAAGLSLGGGNAVIIGNPKSSTDKTEALLRSFGRYVDSLGGRYVTTQDMGTTVDDMEKIASETRHVVGLPSTVGGSGDLSPITAYGVLRAIEACAKNVFGSGSLRGKVALVQGLGKVGTALARMLHQEGAQMIVSDTSEEATRNAYRQFNATTVKPEEAYDTQCDIFCPCAQGGTMSKQNIPRLKTRIVCGAANNQLADDDCGAMLGERGIIYAPDYVANAGSVIQLGLELGGYDLDGAKQRVARIYDTMDEIVKRAETDHIPTSVASDRIVEERIQAMRRAKKIYK